MKLPRLGTWVLQSWAKFTALSPTTEKISILTHTCSLLHLCKFIRRYNNVTPLLQQLHWVSVPERMNFKLCALEYIAVFMVSALNTSRRT